MNGATRSAGGTRSRLTNSQPCSTRSATTARPSLPLPPVTATRLIGPPPRWTGGVVDGIGGDSYDPCPPVSTSGPQLPWPAIDARVRGDDLPSVHRCARHQAGQAAHWPNPAQTPSAESAGTQQDQEHGATGLASSRGAPMACTGTL